MTDHSVDSIPVPGDKRKGSEGDVVVRKPKVRRFDVKTRVPPRNSAGKESNSVASVSSKEGDATLTVSRMLDAEISSIQSRNVSATVTDNLITQEVKDNICNSNENSSETESNPCSVNRFHTSSVEQPSGKASQSSIVDELFKDFIATKIKGVGEEESVAEVMVHLEVTEPADNKKPAVSSMEEINRLLDAEITSIQSRSVVSTLYDDSDVEDSSVGHMVHEAGDASLGIENKPETSGDNQTCNDNAIPSTDKLLNVGSATAAEANVPGGSTAVFPGKKAPVRKLGLSIGLESLARITGALSKSKQLEDGEVASSSDSEREKTKKEDDGDDESANSDDDVSETGSLSDTDDEKTEGKDSKSKKKKKHKHKHKKKKKHKSQSKEKEKEDKEKEKEKDKKSNKDKEKTTEEEGRKESRSKDKKKHSKHGSSSKSPSRRKSGSDSRSESHGKKDRKSRSPSGRYKSKSPSKDKKQQSKKSFDPWDARSYRAGESGTERRRSRSSSPHRSRHRSRERERDRSRDRSKGRSRARSKERGDGRSKESTRDKHRERRKEEEEGSGGVGDLRVKIDKNKLRKIAIANALAKMEAGQGPAVDVTAVKSGGKSVAELTEFCKRISEKERDQVAYDSSDSSSEEEGHKSEGEEALIHHPFKIRDPASLPNIVMNIRNAKQLPVLTPQEKQTQAATLRSQFPVSSGAQHRVKESEWVPVVPTSTSTTTTVTPTTSKPVTPATTLTTPATPAATVSGAAPTPPAPATAITTTQPEAAKPAPQDSVFPQMSQSIDIGSIISERLQAVRRLQQNPFDVQALSSMHKAQEQAKQWAESKQAPGQFTGSTGVQCLTPAELAGPDRRFQAWARKDQFKKAQPIQGGIGMFLLQKMGWKAGEGLGKNNEGNKEPLMLDVKMDRKGLTATQEHRPQPPALPQAPRAKDLSGKHPVSALTELCTKRRWGMPNFDLVNESGPDHKKNFLFKVTVNGMEYCPAAPVGNKKLAKAQAAAICLQEMGLIPRDAVITI